MNKLIIGFIVILVASALGILLMNQPADTDDRRPNPVITNVDSQAMNDSADTDVMSDSDFVEFDPSDQIQAVQSLLTGRWQSTQDELSEREFIGDNQLREVYEGAQVGPMATWQLYSAADAQNAGFNTVFDDTLTYLTISNGTDVMHFAILDVTDTMLQLSYLERGNTLEYTKMADLVVEQ